MRPHEHIRQLRRERGMTQEEAAKRAKMRRTDWVRLESGKHAPTERTMARAAKALGVAIGALVA